MKETQQRKGSQKTFQSIKNKEEKSTQKVEQRGRNKKEKEGKRERPICIQKTLHLFYEKNSRKYNIKEWNLTEKDVKEEEDKRDLQDGDRIFLKQRKLSLSLCLWVNEISVLE